MTTITEGRLAFTFSPTALVLKYDNCSFYKDYFIKVNNGIKAVDFIVSDNHKAYLIEVKDYTHPGTKKVKPTALIDDIVKKIIDTLASIICMKNHSRSTPEEQKVASSLCNSQAIIFIFHIELPTTRGTDLFGARYNPQNLEIKIKSKLNRIELNMITVNIKKTSTRGLPWRVTRTTKP